jgi:hypothetical protein
MTLLKLDLDLWLETRSSDGFDKNLVYSILNTMIEDIRRSNVSTVGSLQSGLSSQSPAI